MQSAFLKKIYISSLTPFEILKFKDRINCSFEKKEQLILLDFWKKSVSKNSSCKIFDEYCQVNKLNEFDISLMTSNIIDFKEEVNFPFWINTLTEVLKKTNLKSHESKDKTNPFYQILFPFLDYFSSALKTSNIKLPNQKIINQLNLTLYQSLFSISSSVLFIEFEKFKKEKCIHGLKDNIYYKKFVDNILLDKYNDLFLKYPMLARKLATKTSRYLNFIKTMFQRFDTDREEIENSFNTKLDEINQIHLNLGDQHNGESTTIFEFNNTIKIVYKPVNISITKVYNQFLEWVSVNIEDKLKVFKVLDKNKYGWLEHVENQKCINIKDIKLYYERAGMLACITYFLNSSDYHFENVIAAGNCPVLIDHETLVSPQIKRINKKTNSSLDKIFGTVLESLLLPTGIKDTPSYASGFGSSIEVEINTVIPKIKNGNKDNMVIVPEMVTKKLYKKNKPILNNKIENLKNYQSEFKTGFEKVYNLILANKPKFLSKNSPLEGFKNQKIRFINRRTGVYFKILKLLNKPEYLSDSMKYGLKLELLARAYAVNGNWSSILSSERKQMLLGDIPAFYTNTISNSIIVSNEEVNIFQLNAFDNIKSKIKNAGMDDFQHQIGLINEVITL
ncbi:type 2 lanthipeptide synthetase LanM [Polaribacter cellanae]|uniref:Type 2 lantipeptide synthetase LanM n=1 Tax=Polaribacter cellanae TaxID=2818493 RepID=A0A975H7C2_9FLAO|nr:type 2 lanthipeptide synthetase LanM [Polaribacter cellanae]QTE23312.1 type 2 lantipeptide synthetase LanM [Polaribacter cellanae]